MILWKAFKHNDNTYSLDHLHPKSVTYTQPATKKNPERTYKVDVEFGLHCFTREIKANDDPKLFYSDAREKRLFDFQRYDLSNRLPDVVETLPTRKCYHTRYGNFFTVDLIKKEPAPDKYEVYFTLSCSSKRGLLNLSLQSAYIRDQQHQTGRPMKSVGFFVLLFNTLNHRHTHPAQ